VFPKFYENSKVPVFLSKFVPINISAISFGLWVWARGLMSARIKNHETIHYKQQVELLFVGQWILYGLFYVYNYIKLRDGRQAYYQVPFEREAYDNDDNLDYLKTRKHYAWIRYIKPS
jgi:hypothetical protein